MKSFFLVLIVLSGAGVLTSCGLRSIKTPQLNLITLPDDVQERFYKHEFTGTYRDNLSDVLGRLIYVYKLNDTTSVLKISPTSLTPTLTNDMTTSNNSPVLKASGKSIIQNDNSIGLFLSAVNMSSETKYLLAAELVVTDSRSISLLQGTAQAAYLDVNDRKIPVYNSNDGTLSLIDNLSSSVSSNFLKPIKILFIKGAHLTTISKKISKSISNRSEIQGAVFKIGNNHFSEQGGFVFDTKIGLTVDDITILYAQNIVPQDSINYLRSNVRAILPITRSLNSFKSVK